MLIRIGAPKALTLGADRAFRRERGQSSTHSTGRARQPSRAAKTGLTGLMAARGPRIATSRGAPRERTTALPPDGPPDYSQEAAELGPVDDEGEILRPVRSGSA